MYTYYLFRINTIFQKLYHEKNAYLYEILEQIYHSKTNEYKILYHFFCQIIDPINKTSVRQYVYESYNNILINEKDTYELNNAYTGETTKIFVGKTYIKIKTNKKTPEFLKKEIKDFFVCDFALGNYYWLEEESIKALV